MIHIIMCTYNGEKYIKEQIESILHNSTTDWRLYISDDGSTDSTYALASEYAKDYPQKIILTTHINVADPSIHFLEKIKDISMIMQDDDYIMLCDQDDIWYNNKIELTLKHMSNLVMKNSNEMPLLVCTDVEVVNEKKEQLSRSFRRMIHYSINKLDIAHLLMEHKAQGCTIMINKALADKIRKLPKVNTIHDMWLEMIAVTMGKMDYVDEPTMAYRRYAEQYTAGEMRFWKMVLEQMKHMKEQKYMVYGMAQQTQEFLRIYGEELACECRELIETFATLEQQGFWQKRFNIIKYHMWKTGVIRNIGMMILL